MFFCRTDGILKKRECVSKLKSAYYLFLFQARITRKTRISQKKNKENL